MEKSKPPKGRFVNDQMIVGIDVAKWKHVAKILFPDGSESPPFPFPNQRQGFEAFLSWLFSYQKRAH